LLAKLAPLQQRKRQADDTIYAAFDTCERPAGKNVTCCGNWKI
jgi:hypothetical protein